MNILHPSALFLFCLQILPLWLFEFCFQKVWCKGKN